jgi:hypothetical protein
LDVADRALQAIEAALGASGITPFLFRKEDPARSPRRRELVIPRPRREVRNRLA